MSHGFDLLFSRSPSTSSHMSTQDRRLGKSDIRPREKMGTADLFFFRTLTQRHTCGYFPHKQSAATARCSSSSHLKEKCHEAKHGKNSDDPRGQLGPVRFLDTASSTAGGRATL